VNQDAPRVFRVIILKEALDGLARLLLGACFWLHSVTGLDSWFVAKCGGKKGLGGKVTQLVSNLVVP
jgi:hypothetical protein